MKNKCLVVLVTYLLCCAAVVHAEEAKVFASNYPLSYFAERISGNSDIVVFPEIDGDPAFWKPEPADIIAMQQSDRKEPTHACRWR